MLTGFSLIMYLSCQDNTFESIYLAVLKTYRSEKKKRIEPERIMLEQGAVDGELSNLDIVQKRTNAKRQKHWEES